MSVYCGTLDVYYVGGHIKYKQLGFGTITTFNNWLDGTLIPKAQDFVDNYVGHDFRNHGTVGTGTLGCGTIVLDGNGKEALPISRVGLVDGYPPILMPVPLYRLESVTIDSGSDIVSSCQCYDKFVTYKNNVFCIGRQNVEIVANYGYRAVPHDIQYVTAQLCVNVLREAIRSRMVGDLITTIMEGSGAIGAIMRSPKVLTDNEKSILERYRYREIEVG